MKEQQAHYLKSTRTPSLTVSLLSQGNNGSFSKPFAFKHGLYAAVLLNELIYLQDLFIHKQNKSMSALGEDSTLITGFFRSYKDLNRATQIPMHALKRKGSASNPISILKKLGILTTASTTIGESFKRVIIYSVDEEAVHNAILEATIDYYEDIESERQEELQKTMKLTVSDTQNMSKSVKNGAIKEQSAEMNLLSCRNNTTVESKGLSRVKQVKTVSKTTTTRKRKKDQSVETTLQQVSKQHSSNNILTSNKKTNSQKNATSGTNPTGKNPPPQSDESTTEFSEELVRTLYTNNKKLYSPIVKTIIEDLTENNISLLTAYTQLRDVAKLPDSYMASNRDLAHLEKIKYSDRAIYGLEAVADKIVRNIVLIECKKRKKAFGQLFVGLNL